jgi:predicted dehydrogenase
LCVSVPVGVSDRDASTVTLGAIALQGVRRLQPTLGETFTVIGLGVLGQITVQLLKSAGARVIGVDVDRARLDEAMRMGLDAAVHPDDADPIAQANRLTDGVGVDGVIVAAASPSSEVMATAFRMCRRKARVVLIGDVGLDLDRNDLYAKELDFLVSTSYGPGRYDRGYEEEGLDYPIAYVRWTENRNMAEYLRQLADGRVRLGGMTAQHFPIERAVDAYRVLSEGATRPLFAFLDYDSGSEPSPVRRIETPVVRKPVKGSLRLGLIGAGHFAKSMHLPLIEKMSDAFTLQAVASRRGYDASSLARLYGASVSTSEPDALLDDPGIDAVLIATRHDSHADLVIKALERGKHVLVEKPLCLSADELRAIEETVARLGDDCPVLMTGFNRRFSAHTAALRKLIAPRTNPFILNYRVNAGHLPPDHWTHGPQGGGRNIGEACHFYDLAGYLAGSEIRSVEARAIRPATAHYGRNDNFVALLTFADGSIANVIYTALGSPDAPKEQIEVFCDGKVLTIGDFRSFAAAGCKAADLNRADKGHAGELAAFARAVQGGSTWPIPLRDQAQAMSVAFEVERLLHSERGGAAAVGEGTKS